TGRRARVSRRRYTSLACSNTQARRWAQACPPSHPTKGRRPGTMQLELTSYCEISATRELYLGSVCTPTPEASNTCRGVTESTFDPRLTVKGLIVFLVCCQHALPSFFVYRV